MKRTITIFAALFFGGALAVAYATTGVKDFSQRWTAAQNALTVAHHGIPEEKLHARALEILRTRVVAADEV